MVIELKAINQRIPIRNYEINLKDIIIAKQLIHRSLWNIYIFQCLPFPGKLLEGFHSYICYFCDQDVCVVKKSADFDHFSRNLGFNSLILIY